MQALADPPTAGHCWFAMLQHAALVNILARVLPRARARAATVCRAWRYALQDPAAWTTLDTSRDVDEAATYHDSEGFTDAALRAVAARAGGGLRTLKLYNCHVSHAAVMDVLTSNAVALRELALWGEQLRYDGANSISAPQLRDVLHAAPALLLVDVLFFVKCTIEEARAILRRQPPYAKVECSRLHVDKLAHRAATSAPLQNAADIVPLASDLSAYNGQIHVSHLEFKMLAMESVSMTALADAVCAMSTVVELDFQYCGLEMKCIPALARLVLARGLTRLYISVADDDGLFRGFLDDSLNILPQLSTAIQTSMLTTLRLSCIRLWSNFPAGSILISALVGHPHLLWL